MAVIMTVYVRKDLLALNVKIFKVQGQAIDQFAKKTCKVLPHDHHMYSLRWSPFLYLTQVCIHVKS